MGILCTYGVFEGLCDTSTILTCVIDQNIQPLLLLQEVLAELSDRPHVGQVQLHEEHVHAVAPVLDLSHSLPGSVFIPTGDDDSGSSPGQSHSRLFADARVTTCKYKNISR